MTRYLIALGFVIAAALQCIPLTFSLPWFIWWPTAGMAVATALLAVVAWGEARRVRV